jgi:L-rhamnose isomerase/sugar isomerase
MVGAADPFQLFRIMHEIVSADALRPEAGIAYMLDQCHNIEPKIPAMIRSVMTLQETFARALLVDTAALRAAQERGDVLEANRLLQDAFQVDVRPMLAELRTDRGLPGDPYRAYLESGEAEAREAARVGGVAASW